MRKHIICFAGMIGLLAGLMSAQEVVEAASKTLTREYRETIVRLETLRSKPAEAVVMLKEALSGIRDPFERFQLLFWEIPSLSCEAGDPEGALKALQEGQEEGFYYPFILGQNTFPPFAGSLEKLEGFQVFLEKNKQLRETDQKEAKFEFSVRLPKQYSPDKLYPALLVITGGFGSHIQLREDWRSPALEDGFITVFLQGDQCMGTFLKAYRRDGFEPFVRAFAQAAERYPVDKTRVYLGAQSAGAHFAFNLALDELIPVAGIVLAFPGTPDLDPAKLKKAAGRGLGVVMLSGGKDPRAGKSKELAALMDRQGMRNRLTVFPEKGHEFPDDFPGELDRALAFLAVGSSLDPVPVTSAGGSARRR